MEKRIKFLVSVILSAVIFATSLAGKDVYAYNYSVGGARNLGTLTVTQKTGGKSANGFYTAGGYEVSYTVDAGGFTAYSEAYGGKFYAGSGLDLSGGCHFAYAPSGTPWNDGALNLGKITGERVVGTTGAESQSFSCSFSINTLSELPRYVAFAYMPAPGAYIHITEERGDNAHVWFYADSSSVPVTPNDSVDTTAPSISISAAPSGTTATAGGIKWGKTATISVTGEDNKSRPDGIRVYKDGTLIKTLTNTSNNTKFTGSVEVTSNGTYSAECYDKLGNLSERRSVSVSCIDTTSPGVSLSSVPSESVSTNPSTGTKWGTKATITAAASDSQSHPAGIRIYKGSSLLKTLTSSSDSASFSGTYTVAENGTYTAEAYDNLGNVSSRSSITVSSIDKDKPVISSFLPENTTYVKKLFLKVNATDAGCGLHDTPYMYKGEWISSSRYEVSENGSYTVKVRDRLGNMESKSVTVSNIDNDPPVINKIEGYDGSFAKKFEISVDASDTGCGLHEEPYGYPDGGWGKENSFTVSENGVYIIRVRDALLNEIQDSITIESIDNEPPKIIKVDKELTPDNKVKISVTAEDNEGGSGLDDKPYSFDGGKTWQEEPFYITDENGEVDIVVRDKLDQRDEEKAVVDEIKPPKKDDDNGGGNGGNGNGDNGGGGGNGDGDDKPDTSDVPEGPGSVGEPAIYHVDNKPDWVKKPDNVYTAIEDPDNNKKPADNGNPGDGGNPGGNGYNGTPGGGNNDDLKKVDKSSAKAKKKKPSKNNTDKEDKSKEDDLSKSDAYADGQPVSENDSNNKKDDEKEEITTVEPDMEELLSDKEPEDEIKTAREHKPMTTGQKVAVALTGFLIGAGLIGALLYLLLYLLRRSCILFGVDEKGRKERLARLFISMDEDGEWSVRVPDDKLGDLGTDDYALSFSYAFLSEHEGEDLIINIDGRSIREKISEEVRFFI